MTCLGFIFRPILRFFERCEFANRCRYYTPGGNCDTDGAYWNKPFCGIHRRLLREQGK
jgi:hypothetical protein